MMSLTGSRNPDVEPAPKSSAPNVSPAGALWVDLHDPDGPEMRRLAAETGLAIPTREALREVQSSSRLRRGHRTLTVSTPMLGVDAGSSVLRPLGFVLTPDRLVTVRFQTLPAFEEAARRMAEDAGASPTSLDVFLLLVEQLVDALADGLEETADHLDALSTRIFEQETRMSADRRAPRERDRMLRRFLRHLGRHGRALRKARASLLGIGRIVPFVASEGCRWFPHADKERFESLSKDILSLDEFETRLSETVQFLLDATLGLINIEQNNTFKVLTIASVVGIPPTLMASVYGMNFKHMPDLDWTYGYAYGLAVIAASGIAPLVYFKLRGWF